MRRSCWRPVIGPKFGSDEGSTWLLRGLGHEGEGTRRIFTGPLRIGPCARMTQQLRDSAASVTQQDTCHMRGEGDVAKCDYAKFLGFRAKTSKIHNFRIRAPFLTFFICTRS